MKDHSKILSNELETLREMVSSFSHELSNSLGICNTLVDYMDTKNNEFWQALERNKINQKQFLNYVKELKSNTEMLKNNLNLANNLLDDFTVVRRSWSVSEIDELNLKDFVNKHLVQLKHIIMSDGYKLETDIESGITLRVSPNYLLQIFLNLLKNAVRHGFEDRNTGKIKIVAYRESETITIIVKDNGRGIPADDLSKIFNEYYTTSVEGTGLGLNITRKLVNEKLNGKITVESVYGEYTQFIITILQTNEEA